MSSNEESSILEFPEWDHLIELIERADDVLSEIGFSGQEKFAYFKDFLQDATTLFDQMLESAVNLQAEKTKQIQQRRHDIRLLAYELDLKYDETFASGLTVLSEEAMLADKCKQLESVKVNRLSEYEDLVLQESCLCKRLMCKPHTGASIEAAAVPTEHDIETLKVRVRELEAVKSHRLNAFLNYREEIIKLLRALNVSQLDIQYASIVSKPVDEMVLSELEIERARAFCEELKRENEELVNQMQILMQRVQSLWAKLDTSNEEIASIVAERGAVSALVYDSSKRELIKKLNKEHERCVKLKAVNAAKFTEKLRLEIKQLNAKLLLSSDEVKAFEGFLSNDEFTEDLLKTHEEALEAQEAKYIVNRNLYDQAAHWLKLWHEFTAFEEKTKDPNRFKQRGFNGASEEKTRKQYKSQFTKLEAELKQLTDDYLQTNNKVFSIYGIEWHTYFDSVRAQKAAAPASSGKRKITNENTQRASPLQARRPLAYAAATTPETTAAAKAKPNRQPTESPLLKKQKTLKKQ